MRVELLRQARRKTKRFVALPSEKTGIPGLPVKTYGCLVHSDRPTFDDLAVYCFDGAAKFTSKTWLESTLRIVLDSHDPSFASPFAEGFLFAGASAAEAEMQQEARDIIQQRKAWRAFHSQEGCEQDFVQGPHLYYNGIVLYGRLCVYMKIPQEAS